MTEARLETVLGLIDKANAADPNMIDDNGRDRPSELVYGERMDRALAGFRPRSSEHLQIAARGQHIERWTSPRKSYPEGRVGYLKWRKNLKDFHARRTAELMTEAGYGEDDCARVGALIRKERLKQDPETQALEDTACLVFLEFYASEFIDGHTDEKVVDILAKTVRKMSPDGIAAAAGLPMPRRLSALLTRALEGHQA